MRNPIPTDEGFLYFIKLLLIITGAITVFSALVERARGSEAPTLAQRWAFQFMTNGPSTRTYVMIGTGTNFLPFGAKWTGRVMTHQAAAAQFKPNAVLRLVEEFQRTQRQHFIPMGAPNWAEYRTNKITVITPSTPRTTNVVEGVFRLGRIIEIKDALWLTNTFSVIDAR